MSILKIKAADTDWFNGSGWYVVTKDSNIVGPIKEREDAEKLNNLHLNGATYDMLIQELRSNKVSTI